MGKSHKEEVLQRSHTEPQSNGKKNQPKGTEMKGVSTHICIFIYIYIHLYKHTHTHMHAYGHTDGHVQA